MKDTDTETAKNSPFDLGAAYAAVGDAYPAYDRRPLIGITANAAAGEAKIAKAYYQSIEAAGGVPVLLPPTSSATEMLNQLERIDALVLSGGGDLNPLYCGSQPVRGLGEINAERDACELLLTRLAFDRQLPIFGICRGIQVMAVALGGSVEQDIYSLPWSGRLLKHSQQAARDVATHSVTLAEGSKLREICGAGELLVNSFHHQAVSETGPLLRATAFAPDGIIEGLESTEGKPVIGVQWHPECLRDEAYRNAAARIFSWLTEEAALYRDARRWHASHVTLDTHCDTPMLMSEGVDIRRRDPRALVDLHKMDEGGLDASIMAAYLPQRERDDASLQAATAMANDILSRIDSAVASAATAAPARTPDDILRNKRAGLHSIVKAIENGYALGRDIANVERFARRGVVYITLCHNGDNDICDSASRSKNEHGGVSQFGEQAIREMNRCGVMVDLSHGGERSFYDALDISRLPIVCSHSSSRALCDHPRNLTDDQLRALSRKGGVAQITFYPGFLRTSGQATIDDVMQHLDHAISIAGLDHVGLGSDFDGDGGVVGVASASEMINITKRLLRKRYSDDDISLIWGGNFMRVMREVQAAAKI